MRTFTFISSKSKKATAWNVLAVGTC